MRYAKTVLTRRGSVEWAILLVLLLAFGSCSHRTAEYSDFGEQAGDSLDIRVMSFNIRVGTANDGANHWRNRQQLVFEVLRDHQADAIGLQEAMRFQIDQIRKALPEYGEVGVSREDGKTKGEYVAILYGTDRFKVDDSGTFWFSDTPEVPGSTHWGNAHIRICTWVRLVDKQRGYGFYVFNVHLDNVSQFSREKSVALLAERIAGRRYAEPVIVTGDFNAGEDNIVIQYLKDRTAFVAEGTNPIAMVDTFRVLHPDAEETGTFNGFRGKCEGDKIDYIFVQPDIRVLEAEIIHTNQNGRYPSNHFPVTARILLPTVLKR